MLRDALDRIAAEYPKAHREVFAGHPLASFIRDEAAKELHEALGEQAGELICKGSAGAGNFATVPWLAVFDPVVTDTATKGYYVVYLFAANGSAIYLSLNQGTTAVREEFKGEAQTVLRDRAALMRTRLLDFESQLAEKMIALASTQTLPRDYEAGHALGCFYQVNSLPTEDQIRADLQTIVSAYRALTFRGALDPSPEVGAQSDDFELPAQATSIVEIRRYRMHRKIERNSRASIIAKRFHGTRCQACGLDFGEKYGELGNGYIEAHHLKPMSSLAENVQVSFDIAADFAVLCSNCHRMIHRAYNPSDLLGLQTVIAKQVARKEHH